MVGRARQRLIPKSGYRFSERIKRQVACRVPIAGELFARRNPMAVNPAAANAAPQITGAIQQAAKSSGISFEYLLTTAQIESNLNPSAQASTSSAKGLYQFIEQ